MKSRFLVPPSPAAQVGTRNDIRLGAACGTAKAVPFPQKFSIGKILITACLLCANAAWGQDSGALGARVRAYRQANEAKIVREYADLLAIPNLASDSANIRNNAAHIASMMRQRGISARLLEEAGGPPIVYGELSTAGARHTLIFYAHYDGQHVDASQWATPPWTPVLRDKALEQDGKEVPLTNLPASIPGEWRLYARSAGDDKAAIEALMQALDALRAVGARPAVNLKFFFEGEEEAGSPHLPAAIQQYASLLQGDAWLLCDGPEHPSGRQLLYFGARGSMGLEMTVYGPTRAMHDGHYGNWAPNPAVLLAELVSSMRDREARIKIPGFEQDVRPLTESERRAIAAMPAVDEQMRRELGLAWSEGAPEPLAMRIMHPAINVRGLESGHVGEKAQNAIPTEARASLDFRLVPDQKPERIRELVEEHIRRQGFTIVHQAPTPEERLAHPRIIRLDWEAGYPAARTSMDLPVSRALVAAIGAVTGPAVQMPMMGASVPLYLFTDVLHTPVIGLPIANYDDNQHAANENLRLENLWNGMEMFAGILAQAETSWK